MIIVSQDKKMFVNFNSIVSVYVIKNYISEEKGYKGYNIDFATNEEINFVLATYETEERAKEVLQGIINAYEKAGNIAFETSEDERLMRLTHNSSVFEMPGK